MFILGYYIVSISTMEDIYFLQILMFIFMSRFGFRSYCIRFKKNIIMCFLRHVKNICV